MYLQPVSETIIPLRKWQDHALGETDRILFQEDRTHIYISAPTASGKSRYMFEVCETVDVSGERIILVGLDQIVRQLRDNFVEKFGCLPLSDASDSSQFLTPSQHLVTITTWQSLGRRVARSVGILILDECHFGGSGDQAKTIPDILERFDPTKRVYVSATTQTANERLLGSKKDHFYRYSYAEAYEDGVLNPLDLVEVHTGVNVEIEAIQNATGKNMTDLEELQSSDLHDLAETLQDRSVGYGMTAADVETRVREIIRYRHTSMIELYLHSHAGEQAIFFSPNIEVAEQATHDFNSRARRKGPKVRAEFCHSKVGNAREVIDRFKSGQIKVVFVVGMLQEGFDLDTLWLGFDCRFHSEWNPSRIARFAQRMGRLMRLSEDKPVSKYYFSRDIKHFYNHSAIVPSIPMMVEEEFEDDVASVAANDSGAGIFAARVLHEMETREADDEASLYDQRVDVFESVVTDIETEDRAFDEEAITPPGVKKIKLISTPLYLLKRARGHTIVRTFSVASLFGNPVDSVEENILALIALHDAGAPRPQQRGKCHKERKLSTALSGYTNVMGQRTNPDRYARLVKGCPRWVVDPVEENILALLAMHNAGTSRPKANSQYQEERKLATAFNQYTNGATKKKNPDRYARLVKGCPRWVIDRVEENILALIALHDAGAPRPQQRGKYPKGKNLGTALSGYTNVMGQRTNPDRYARLVKGCPRWVVDPVEENILALIALHAAGGARPNSKSENPEEKKLGGALIHYLTRKHPDRYTRIVNGCQRWVVDKVEENILALLAVHAAGAARPSAKSENLEEKKLGQVFTAYTKAAAKTKNPDRYDRLVNGCPRWLIDQVEENILALIALHDAGANRPSSTSKNLEEKKLGTAFTAYTSSAAKKKSPDRYARIVNGCPRWLVDHVEENIRALLALHAAGAERPKSTIKDPEEMRLASAFNAYTSEATKKKNPDRYARLVKGCPRWVIDRVEENILALIALHAAGADRPKSTSKNPEEKKLGLALIEYTKSNNQERRARIVKACQRWFIDHAEAKTIALLALHAAGADRPKSTSKNPEEKKLAQAFIAYTGVETKKKNPDRHARLVKGCPRWLVDPVEENILALIAMHDAGLPRPSTTSKDAEQKRLGSALSVYTTLPRRVVNPERATRIIERCPRWFK